MKHYAALTVTLIASSLVLAGCSQSAAASLSMCTAASVESNFNGNRPDTRTHVSVTTAPLKTLAFPLSELANSRSDAVCDAVVTQTFISQNNLTAKFQVVLFRGSLNSLHKSVSAVIKPRGWTADSGDGVTFITFGKNGTKAGGSIVATKGHGSYVIALGTAR